VSLAITGSLLIGIAITSGRWLRVTQREHYLAPSVTRFALRWWMTDWPNRTHFLALLLLTIATWFVEPVGFAVAVVVATGPRGLSLRGRTSRLAWTRRLRTVAASFALLVLVGPAIGHLFGVGPAVTTAIALGAPSLMDAALAALAPVERKLARRFVKQASARLDQIDPVRVAITGSYGKTTIKGFVRHLLSGTRAVVVSPASFNNTAGLSRTVNEHLSADTEVFVAEMGTYRRGEIAEMCSWIRPSVSVLAAIGPVHLERFGDLDTIVSAKSEVFATSKTAILNIDAHGLAVEADRLAASGIRVIRCSSVSPDADVYVQGEGTLTVWVAGKILATDVQVDAAPTNVACAVAVARVTGVSDEVIAERLPGLPAAEHRRQVVVADSGITIIDDTYNSNPAGADAAVATLNRLKANRKVVVTPGMVELGNRQRPENEKFGQRAAQVADDLLIVARVNSAALTHGARGQKARIHHTATREEAVQWVRDNLSAGDAVLYENDLPDHFP